MAKTERELRMPDGACRAWLFSPGAAGSGAAVILYMDAFGLRPALEEMAERLCREGYGVLVPDTMYRFAPYGPFDPLKAWGDPALSARMKGAMAGTTQQMSWEDTASFLAVLDEAGFTGPVGTVGYCMGGPRALNAAAAYPDRIVAAASFHGGNLAADAPDSPASRAEKIKARLYVGNAGVDNSFPPEQSAALAQKLREAGVDYMLENYPGMKHGWAVPDHSVYDEAGAGRAWTRLVTLFGETLAG